MRTIKIKSKEVDTNGEPIFKEINVDEASITPLTPMETIALKRMLQHKHPETGMTMLETYLSDHFSEIEINGSA